MSRVQKLRQLRNELITGTKYHGPDTLTNVNPDTLPNPAFEWRGKKHDKRYADLERHGVNPMYTFTYADQAYLDGLEKDKIKGILPNNARRIAKTWFNFKKNYLRNEDTDISELRTEWDNLKDAFKEEKEKSNRNMYSKSKINKRLKGKVVKKSAVKKKVAKIVKGSRKTVDRKLATAEVLLAKRVKKLEDVGKAESSLLIAHAFDTLQLLAAVSVANTGNYIISTTTLDSALAGLRYFNPAAPGTPITGVDFATAASINKTVMMRHETKHTFRNNFNVPVRLQVWLFEPKGTATDNISTLFSSNSSDIGLSTTSIVTSIDEVRGQFKDQWTCSWNRGKVLKSGEEYHCSIRSKWFTFNVSSEQNQTGTLTKGYKAYNLHFRISGVLGHDSVNTTTQIAPLPCGIDLLTHFKCFIKYEGGTGGQYHIITSNITNPVTSALSGVINNPDNIAFSAV